MPRATRLLLGTAAAAVVVAAAVAAASAHYDLGPAKLAEQVLRVTAAPVLAVAYGGDLDAVAARTASYVHGEPPPAGHSPEGDWNALTTAVPGFQLTARVTPAVPWSVPPFVYESPDAPHLAAFRERYSLAALIEETASEYEAILRLGGWVGRQFDHGTDRTVGGDQGCDPIGLVESGRAGARYWCEIAARLMVHAAASLGFPARIVTASTDGYTWEHAVAEIWSNEFRKWIVVDTDFNQVYERRGVPLSATELMRHGLDWQRAGELTVRQIAPEKPNSPRGGNPVALYRYVHVDLRTDWCTRPLRRGSPAGGDRMTWWVAEDGFRPLLTAKRRVDEITFDWPENIVQVVPVGLRRDGERLRLEVGFRAYGSAIQGFETRTNGADWVPLDGARYGVRAGVGVGETTIEIRAQTLNGFPGPTTRLTLTVRTTTTPTA